MKLSTLGLPLLLALVSVLETTAAFPMNLGVGLTTVDRRYHLAPRNSVQAVYESIADGAKALVRRRKGGKGSGSDDEEEEQDDQQGQDEQDEHEEHRSGAKVGRGEVSVGVMGMAVVVGVMAGLY
ncbi:hypothetical protein BDZ91DRAFT_547645 [Kalaharituber pfeilii]|nr:hypothetical protein BDZ91DRAFT_547645 [Kalaharituber pfeilii]